MTKGTINQVGNSSMSWRTRLAVTILVFLGAGALLGWAGGTLLRPPAPLPTQQTHAVVAATEGAISRSIRLSAAAHWTGGTTVGQLAEGTVTAVHLKAATTVKTGQRLYDVNLRPVFIGRGAVPAFRPLTLGVTGADVGQLQELLIAVGERSAAPTEQYDGQTARQVRAWQRATKQTPTGQIRLGDVVFVPTLPGTVALGDGITVGGQVTRSASTSNEPSNSGDVSQNPNAGAVIRVLPVAPTFSITLPESQARLVRAGMKVTIDHESGRWQALVDRIGEAGQDGSSLAILKSQSRSPICKDDCRKIPLTGDSSLDAGIEVIPEAHGVVVPAASLVVSPDGTSAVRREDGTEVRVRVISSVGGRSIVEGISSGDRIRVAASPAS